MNKKLFLFLVIVLLASGCATVSVKESLVTYSLNNTTYYSLPALCELRGVAFKYDTFARTASLSKDNHSINLMLQDSLILVDGRAVLLDYPVDIHQGVIVVPLQFKEKNFDPLFKTIKEVPIRRKRVFSPNIKKVVVDAGHGGNDPGAISRTGLKEKDVNLDIAKRLAVRLRASGVEVVMTRNTDNFIPLGSRANIANNSRADLFISIHANANRTRSLNGFEVYYVSSSISDTARAVSSAKNAHFNFDSTCLVSQSQNLKAILWDLLYTYNRRESIELSRAICNSAQNNLNVRVIGVKDARYAVLRGAQMPAVLVEVGFLSNPNEERLLRDSNYREKLSESIMEGIVDYASGIR
jgi:N-acetylmuramoyl-L-alanine amidase